MRRGTPASADDDPGPRTQRSICATTQAAELRHHAELLDALGPDAPHEMQIHPGGHRAPDVEHFRRLLRRRERERVGVVLDEVARPS